MSGDRLKASLNDRTTASAPPVTNIQLTLSDAAIKMIHIRGLMLKLELKKRHVHIFSASERQQDLTLVKGTKFTETADWGPI